MYETTRLGQMILNQWREHWPQMTAELEKNGQLSAALYQAQEQTGDLLYELLSVQKMDYQEAWEIATREFAIPANCIETEKDPDPA